VGIRYLLKNTGEVSVEHSRVVATDKNVSNLYVEYDDSLPVTCRKVQVNNDGTYAELVADSVTYNGEFWVSSVSIPTDICYLVIEVLRDGNVVDYVVNRVGEPDLKVFYTNSEEDGTNTIPYEQYSSTGMLLDSGDATHLVRGIYYINPVNQFESLLKFNGSTSKVLKLPYIVVPLTGGGDGVVGDGLFLDTGFSTYGFIGNRNSYFNLNAGMWIDDENSIAKASDLAKAIASRYGLEWDDKTSPTHIYKYVNYLRTYDEENGVFRLYAPSITPETNAANFDLVEIDELGNTFVKGISMLLLQDLETIPEGSSGAIVDFRTP
jgi:hypothetical protein